MNRQRRQKPFAVGSLQWSFSEAERYLNVEVVEALKRVREIALDPTTPASVRLDANRLLIEQTLGKPCQRQEISGRGGGPVQIEQVEVVKNYSGNDDT